MSADIRILFLADSHLGFDLPGRPRVERRRRGHDFLANYATALEPALAGEVDVVIHGGDVFDRPFVPASLAYQAFAPLVRIAQRGVPVFIVPGNHERGCLPHAHFAAHRNVHIFDRPRTFAIAVRGTRITLSGFPYERRDVRTRFPELVERTDWRHEDAALRLLCIHHCVEGATVGPADFTFTSAADVIRVRDVPANFAAVLSGHIHRRQVLTTDLRRQPVNVPVLYPGSIERTALAEMGETKGFVLLHAEPGANRIHWEFRDLPARPMIVRELMAGDSAATFDASLRALVAAAPRDAVLTIRVAGTLSDPHWRSLAAARLRTFVPATMNVEIQVPDDRSRRPRAPRPPTARPDGPQVLLNLGMPAT